MLLQEAPPNTSAYMIAGFTVFFVISAIYVASLALRHRNLRQDLEVLESIRADSERPTQPRAVARAGAGPGKATKATRRQPRPSRKKVTRRK